MEYLLSQVNQYCERTDGSLWSEPVNFLTNGAFFVAALGLWFVAGRKGLAGHPAVRALIFLIILIGVGSGLFHSFATRWAEWCDIIPISLFVLLFLGTWLRLALLRSYGSIAVAYVTFFALHVACIHVFRSSPMQVGGSEPYFATAIFLLALGRHQQRHMCMRTPYLMVAGMVFVGAMVLRSIDRSICSYFPLGTHLFWHLGCALVTSLLVAGLIDVLQKGRGQAC